MLTNNLGGLHSFCKKVVSALKETGNDVIISAPYNEKTHFFNEDWGYFIIMDSTKIGIGLYFTR